ncbi:MAG: hypothetical protein V1724_08930 [Chloroflexota bacterium]
MIAGSSTVGVTRRIGGVNPLGGRRLSGRLRLASRAQRIVEPKRVRKLVVGRRKSLRRGVVVVAIPCAARVTTKATPRVGAARMTAVPVVLPGAASLRKG